MKDDMNRFEAVVEVIRLIPPKWRFIPASLAVALMAAPFTAGSTVLAAGTAAVTSIVR